MSGTPKGKTAGASIAQSPISTQAWDDDQQQQQYHGNAMNNSMASPKTQQINKIVIPLQLLEDTRVKLEQEKVKKVSGNDSDHPPTKEDKSKSTSPPPHTPSKQTSPPPNSISTSTASPYTPTLPSVNPSANQIPQSQNQTNNYQSAVATPISNPNTPLSQNNSVDTLTDTPEGIDEQGSRDLIDDAKNKEPEPIIIQHPLEYEWCFWTKDVKKDKDKSALSFGDNYIQFCEVSTIEQFWGCVNSLESPNEWPGGTDVLVFRKGIQPKWEDDANKNGSSFMTIQGKESGWIDLLIMIMGNTLPHSNYICGAVCAIRMKASRQRRLILWIRTDSSQNPEIVDSLKQSFLEVLGAKDCDITVHKDALAKEKK